MLVELIVTPIVSVFLGLLNLLPAMPGFVIRDEIVTWFGGVISTASAFLPIGDLFVMLGIWLATVNFAVIWRLIQRAWDALPFT